MKKFLDYIFAFLLSIVIAPLILIISVIIRVDSKGPIFFKQERLGKNGEIFKIYKFRTMIINAEEKGSGIYTNSNDPRITKVGNFLRKTSLDEIPQIINIMKGEMSFVGPRPPVPYHPKKYEKYPTHQKERFNMKPGITGLAQVTGRNYLDWDERIELDVKYVRNWSLLLDAKIIYRTLLSILKKEDVYRKE